MAELADDVLEGDPRALATTINASDREAVVGLVVDTAPRRERVA